MRLEGVASLASADSDHLIILEQIAGANSSKNDPKSPKSEQKQTLEARVAK